MPEHEAEFIYENLDSDLRTKIDMGFVHKAGLDIDAGNPWDFTFSAVKGNNFQYLHPLLHYEDYQRQKVVKWAPEHAEIVFNHIMALSDPEAVAKYNELVDLFNEDLERIKTEQDTDKAIELITQALNLLGIERS